MPHYHGWWVFLASALPAILFIAVWAAGTRPVPGAAAIAELPTRTADTVIASQSLELGMVSGIARGLDRLSDAKNGPTCRKPLLNCADPRRQRVWRLRRRPGLHDPYRRRVEQEHGLGKQLSAASSRSCWPLPARSLASPASTSRARAHNNVERVILGALSRRRLSPFSRPSALSSRCFSRR